MAYQRPMVTVDQNMTVAPLAVDRDQPAFVFGPNYVLHRYGDADEKANTAVGTYVGEAMEFAYPGVADDSMVDRKGYTKLFGDNVVVEIADLTGNSYAGLPEKKSSNTTVAANGGYTKLLVAGKDFVGKSDSSDSDPYDGLKKALAKDDKVVVFYQKTGESKVYSFLTTIVDVGYDTEWDIDTDSSFEGGLGTLITIADAVPDAGLNETSVKVSLVAIENGVEFTKENIKAYSQTSTASWQWEEKEITESGRKFNGVSVTTLNAEAPYGYFDETTLCKVLFADLYLTYRELDDSYSDSIHSITGGASEVSKYLGTVDPDNPLAMGLYMAALNAATDDGDETPPVYFMSVPSDDEDGYDFVLGRASMTDRIYCLAPTTRDKTVIDKVLTHVEKYSSKEEKMWRIGAASVEVPKYKDILVNAADVDGDDWLAIPVSENGPGTEFASDYDMIRIVKSGTDISGNIDAKFLSIPVRKGDYVRFNWRNDPWTGKKTEYDTYIVTEVVNNYTVRVKNALTGGGVGVLGLTPNSVLGSYGPAKVEVFHEYAPKERADEIASLSRNLASRRMLNVFPSQFEYDGVTMTGEFAACAVAGLVSATEPQQPITNVSVKGITGIPLTYQTFNKEELDVIASGGTFIVCQDLPNDIVYVRHQITTAYAEGNINTAELSITRDVDYISYRFADAFRPYFGKYNITPGLISILETTASGLISELGMDSSAYGPYLISDDTVINYVRQNALCKDHVDVSVNIAVPYPCNVIEIVLTV